MSCKNGNFWKMDVQRAFFSWRWVLSVVGVFLAFCFCSVDMYYSETALMDIVDNIFWGRMVMLTIPFCTFAFGDCLCSDCEKKFYRLLYIRGDRRRYLRSKTMVCFVAAAGAMLVGFLLFCFVLSFQFPVMIKEADYSYIYMQGYGVFLKSGRYGLYFFLVGMQFGLLAGILSTAAMALSAFIVNRLLVFAAPLFIYYFMINLFTWVGDDKPYLQMHLIFKACHSNPWVNDWLNLGWVILISFLFLFITEKTAQWGMDRRCRNG